MQTFHQSRKTRNATKAGRRSQGEKCISIRSVAGLDTPVMYVKGVGPRVAEMLAAKGIQTAEDLLYHLPFRYEDRQNPRSLDELQPGETASVIAEVRGSHAAAHAQGARSSS